MNPQISKLVRDNIPQMLSEERARQVQFRTLTDSEYVTRLNQKLLEEVDEYLEAKNIEELADIYEVLDAITKEKGIDVGQVKTTLQNRYPLQLESGLKELAERYIQTEDFEALVDAYEALEAIIRINQFDSVLIGTTKEQKRLERGGFEKHLLMETL